MAFQKPAERSTGCSGMSDCQGACANFSDCEGEVRQYRISGGHWDGLEFYYCEIAAAIDWQHGMTLELMKDNDEAAKP